eukprot:CAMPEP_0117484502 /NCGR_PEP_ID=MMETSP0784-20121206/14489_1 /TAXON_ID=39447 /ORGANISM="" /LENGTH=400 /DNA_ID=CAMNT_0005279073 /DNA_START=330 /DNA_END=1532 /DNA_ORIENTATION=+
MSRGFVLNAFAVKILPWTLGFPTSCAIVYILFTSVVGCVVVHLASVTYDFDLEIPLLETETIFALGCTLLAVVHACFRPGLFQTQRPYTDRDEAFDELGEWMSDAVLWLAADGDTVLRGNKSVEELFGGPVTSISARLEGEDVKDFKTRLVHMSGDRMGSETMLCAQATLKIAVGAQRVKLFVVDRRQAVPESIDGVRSPKEFGFFVGIRVLYREPEDELPAPPRGNGFDCVLTAEPQAIGVPDQAFAFPGLVLPRRADMQKTARNDSSLESCDASGAHTSNALMVDAAVKAWSPGREVGVQSEFTFSEEAAYHALDAIQQSRSKCFKFHDRLMQRSHMSSPAIPQTLQGLIEAAKAKKQRGMIEGSGAEQRGEFETSAVEYHWRTFDSSAAGEPVLADT